MVYLKNMSKDNLKINNIKTNSSWACLIKMKTKNPNPDESCVLGLTFFFFFSKFRVILHNKGMSNSCN